MTKEILEGSASIAKFMGYVHIKDNVLYDTCDDTSFKHYTYETVYSKTPIYVDSEDFLQEVKNPDYGNNDNPRWNPNLETLNWASLNEHFINPKYHTSWDWLMPVCKKLDRLVEDGIIDYSMVYEAHCDNLDDAVTRSYDISEVFPVVVQFIHFYNTQSK